ncbi:hypothetical protein ABQF26_04410 [Mycolicibacterium elephantis]
MRAHLDVTTSISVVTKRDPARISVRVGPVFVTMTEAEALALANDIADVVATLRAAYPRERP